MSGGRRGKAKGTRAADSKGVAAASASQTRPVRSIAARYDAAQTTDENRKHWAMADGLDANMANSPAVRRILRMRARYEVANNTYGQGIVETLATHCIGTGPRLQMSEALSDSDAKVVERGFGAWAKAIGLAEKLRTLRTVRAVDGEGFAALIDNPDIATPVHLDIRLIEADQIASANLNPLAINAVDGIRFDAFGNPIEYDVLRQHPGGMAVIGAGQAVSVPAAQILHFFVARRPGQYRGIPDIMPALPLFGNLRRWTLAVIAAAETAADIAAIMYTDQGPDGGEAEKSDAWERVEFERRALMTAPMGWKVEQLKAEQPTSTYAEVKGEILDEIARCVLMPSNIARGNSSGYNFSSAKLDNMTYRASIEVDRTRIEAQVLDRIFMAWVREARLIEGYLPQTLRNVTTDWSHEWLWPAIEVGNPKDEEPAATERLNNGTSTMQAECARLNRDYLEVIAQREREAKECRAAGLLPPWEAPPAAPATKPADANDAGDVADPADEPANATRAAYRGRKP